MTSPSTDESVLDLADRFFIAIETGDLDAVRGAFADDAVVCTNFGGEASADDTMKVLRWLIRRAEGLRYDVQRRDEIPGGFLQEHVLRAVAPDGTTVAMPACIIATVHGGRIARLDEYLDPSQVAALANRPPG